MTMGILATAVFLLVIVTILWKLMRWSDTLPREEDRIVLLLFGTPLLMGVASYTIMASGLAGAFPPRGGLLMALAIVCAAGLGIAKLLPKKFVLSNVRPDGLSVILIAVLLGLSVMTLTGALAPPTSNEWDTLAYHFAAPKVWLHDGRIHMLPYDNHAGFPMLTEMLYAWGLSWGGFASAKLVHWFYGMLCALTCYWAGRHWVSRKAGLLAAALFVACPAVGWEATTAYVDLAATLYVSLAVFAFLRWVEALPPGPSPQGRGEAESPHPQLLSSGERVAGSGPHPQPLSPGERGAEAEAGAGWLWLAGLCGGFACGVKMTMIATSGLLVLWAVGLAIRKRAPWQSVGLLTALIAAIGAPWYIKTWIWTGNPVYPFAYGIFGGKWWGAAQAAQYAAEQARFGIGKTLYGLWVAPWSTAFQAQYYANPPAAFRGALETASGSGLFPAVFGTLGLGVIGLLPLWFLGRAKGAASRAPGWLAAYGGVFVLIWFGLTHQTRYLIPILPVLLVPSVVGARAFWRRGHGWQAGIGSFCAVALLWGIVPLMALVQPAWGVAWGGESQDAYLTRMEPIYNVSKAINTSLPPAAKVLMLNDVRGFYLDRPYQWGDAAQSMVIPWDRLATVDQMDGTLRAQGITHILINWGPSPAATERWPALAKQALASGAWRPVLQDRHFAVYAVVR